MDIDPKDLNDFLAQLLKQDVSQVPSIQGHKNLLEALKSTRRQLDLLIGMIEKNELAKKKFKETKFKL